jgi:hypothetical protein
VYVVADDDRLLPLRRVPLETRRAAVSVKVCRERTTARTTTAGRPCTRMTVIEQVVEYKFWNKVDALGKLYARLADGSVKFHKDGYTDVRGRFDYASVNTPERQPVERFAVLVHSDDRGAVIREAAPPQQ